MRIRILAAVLILMAVSAFASDVVLRSNLLTRLGEEITLDLAKLPFEQAELTAEAVVELARLADRLLGEPWRRLRIEAEFGLPDLGVRTLTERRVEVVRAFFRARGVAPARLVVHATGAGPLPPPTTSLAAPAQ